MDVFDASTICLLLALIGGPVLGVLTAVVVIRRFDVQS